MRSLLPSFGVVVLVTACASAGSSSPTAEPRGACVWQQAACLRSLCQGCVAGPYVSCPPKDAAYSTECSETTEENCRSLARPPSEWYGGSNPATYYTRDLRYHPDVTCSNRASAPAPVVICSGVCK
ncbi:MAG: hypothetical protein IPJ34_08740 [Myxococcales bacterium]|nr:hypothetical protein [Myxococcales bacterium]